MAAATTKSFPAMHLEFNDGTEEDIRLDRPELHLAFRRSVGRRPDLEDIADMFHLCYIKLGSPLGTTETALEQWMTSIFDYQMSSVTVARPTKRTTASSKE